jgi:hypothetical protein
MCVRPWRWRLLGAEIAEMCLYFAEGLKALFCGLPFGLSRHTTEEFIEHKERRISQCRFEPDHRCHQHRTPAWYGQFPNVLHRRAQTVGS